MSKNHLSLINQITLASDAEIRHIDKYLLKLRDKDPNITYHQLLEKYNNKNVWNEYTQTLLRSIWSGEFTPTKLNILTLSGIAKRCKEEIVDVMVGRISHTLGTISAQIELSDKNERSKYNAYDIGNERSVMILSFNNGSIPIIMRYNTVSTVHDAVTQFKSDSTNNNYVHLISVLEKCSHKTMDREILRVIIEKYKSMIKDLFILEDT